jgi:histidinol-phosphate aminotransferase
MQSGRPPFKRTPKYQGETIETNHQSMRKKKFLAKLEEYIPGRSIEEVAEEFDLTPKKIIKLASNENPFGPSQKAKEAIRKNLNTLHLFPDPLSLRELKRAISRHDGVEEKNIVLGAGSDGVFDTLSKILIDTDDEAIIPTPTFSMYEFVTIVAGGKPVFSKRDKNFAVDPQNILSLVSDKTKLIFLCSPNNPSGNLMPKEDIEEIVQKASCYVLVDEAYIEYAAPGSSVVGLFKKYNNVIISRTFSKVYGLANLRIGYAFMPNGLVKDYEKTNLPFFTSSMGIRAANVAIKDQQYAKKIIQMNHTGREYIENNAKCMVYPSEANFVLADVSPLNGKDIVLKLQRQGIILRSCASFGSGMDSYIRISVGTMEQNKKMIYALNKFFPER